MIGSGGHFRHLIAEGCDPSAALVAIGDNDARLHEAQSSTARWDKFISSKAVLYVFSEQIGEGSQILAGAIIHAPLGKHCIVGNNAVVSHDCEIADYCFVGPGAILCGGAKLQEGAFVGAGAVVTPGAIVPMWATIKAGERWSKK